MGELTMFVYDAEGVNLCYQTQKILLLKSWRFQRHIFFFQTIVSGGYLRDSSPAQAHSGIRILVEDSMAEEDALATGSFELNCILCQQQPLCFVSKHQY